MDPTSEQEFDKPRDSRLREFLRRAGPILAAERGWNERSRLKLKSLAEDLMLPYPLYEKAIQRLQSGELNWDKFLSLYEKKYVQYLQAELTRAKGRNKVLTASHEKKALRIAKKNFQIPSQRARQLLRQVTEDMGMSRVNQSDAQEHVEDLIAQTLGSSTHVSGKTRSRILAAGQRWGLDTDRINALIQTAIDENLRRHKPANPIWIKTAAGAVALACMACVAYFAYIIAGGGGATTYREPNLERVETPKTDELNATFRQAAWWSPQTGTLFAKIQPWLASHELPVHQITASDPAEREQGLRRLLQAYFVNRGRDDEEVGPFISNLLADACQEENVNLTGLFAWFIELPPQKLPREASTYRNALAAVDLLADCYDRCSDPVKKSRINQVALETTGIELAPGSSEFVTQSRQAIAEQHWQKLSLMSYSDPVHTAKLVEPLGELTRDWFADHATFELATVTTILRVRPSVWRSFKNSLARMIEEADADQVFEWNQLNQTLDDSDLSDWLTRQLAIRIGLETDNVPPRRLRQSISAHLDRTDEKDSTFHSRWVRLQRLGSRAAVDQLDFNHIQPQVIADTAFFATLACVLHRAQVTGDRALLTLFDQISREQPRDISLRSLRNTPYPDNLPVYRRIGRRPLPSDHRNLRESLQKLETFDQQSPAGNAIALERLAASADRFRDLDAEQATMLARFLLAAQDTAEIIAMEKHAPQFQHWANLSIALADEIPDSQAKLDHAITIANLVTGLTFEAATDGSWQPALQTAILQRVALGLQFTAEENGEDVGFRWDELRSYLLELNRIRAQALDIDQASISAATTALELNRLMIDRLIETHGTWRRAADSLDKLADQELPRYVLSGQLMVHAVSQINSPVANQPRHPELVAQFAARNQNAESIVQQLLNNELTLYQLWSATSD